MDWKLTFVQLTEIADVAGGEIKQIQMSLDLPAEQQEAGDRVGADLLSVQYLLFG